MNIFPAIDLYEKQAVRLFKGDFNKITVYDKIPLNTAKKFEESGSKFLHLVDLEGAKNGDTPNIDVIKEIADNTNLFIEVGGGIRSMEVIEKYISIGVSRVILGTAAIKDREFLKKAVCKYKEKIAVGADIHNGNIAIKGWTETTSVTLSCFIKDMENIGVKTVICTDISKDGAMKGTNLELYKKLSKECNMNIIASGGVSSYEDIKELAKMDIYGAIVGKAYYEGAIKIDEAIKIAEGRV